MAKPTDDELVVKVKQGIRMSVGYGDSRLSSERLNVVKYLNGDLPRPVSPSSSRYISRDVFDGHEAMKAQLIETFSGNYELVTFEPNGPEDVALAQEATDSCSYVIYRQNNGFSVFRDVIDDSLIGRAGVVKVWWESRKETVPFEMTNTSYQELAQVLTSKPDHEIDKIEEDEEGGIKRVILSIEKDTSQVRLLNVPPEEFFISPRSVDVDTAALIGHKYRRSRADLLRDGYKASLLDELPDEDMLYLTTEPELIERHQQTDDTIIDAHSLNGDDVDRQFMIYECYTRVDLDGTGKTQLCQLIICGDKLLHKQPYARVPFKLFVPLPRPHSVWGTSYDSLLIPTQNSRTAMVRGIEDHMRITNSPRYMVAPGGLPNPRELMENRIGGIVNVKNMMSIAPLPMASLNPFVFQTIGLLNDDKEQLTGISRLSQGLNKDAVSKQNSEGMVENLVNMSQVRQKVVARNFAENFLAPLYLEVYRLLNENETTARMVQIAGQWQRVDPTTWPERDQLKVTFTLGYGEHDKLAARYEGIFKNLSASQGLARCFGEAQQYALAVDALKAMGIKGIDRYLVDPKTLPPPTPDPLKQAEIAMKNADAQVKIAQAQAASTKTQLELSKEKAAALIDAQRVQMEQANHTEQQGLERAKLAHKALVDAAEIEMQQAIEAKAQKDSASTVAMPTR